MAKDLDMGDDDDDDSDDSDDDSQDGTEVEDPMKFSQRKKLSGSDVNLGVHSHEGPPGDISAALDVFDDLFRRSKNDLDLIVALADTGA